jgi:hypothetical protein
VAPLGGDDRAANDGLIRVQAGPASA